MDMHSRHMHTSASNLWRTSAVEKEQLSRLNNCKYEWKWPNQRDGIGRDPGSLAFEGDHGPYGGVQVGVVIHDSPGHHKETEQQESSGESVRLGRVDSHRPSGARASVQLRVAQKHDWVSLSLSCTWTPACLGKAQGYTHGLCCGHSVPSLTW